MAKNLLKKFQKTLPNIYKMAINNRDEELFFELIRSYALLKIDQKISKSVTDSASLILDMLEYEKRSINELSRGKKIYIESFSKLWSFLNSSEPQETNLDMYEDLYHIFCYLEGVKTPEKYSKNRFVRHMNRWATGLDKEIKEKRAENRDRIIELLVKKIEKRPPSVSSRYLFTEGLSDVQKRKQVEKWWKDFRFHLAMAVKSPSELNLFLGESLSTKTMRNLTKAKNKGIPFFVTPYYLSLLSIEEKGFDDYAIRSYVLYSESLVDTFGNIKAWEREDIVEEGKPNAAGWLLPDGHNIHRRYPEVSIMIPETRGRSCGGLCSSCQRMYDFQSERLNFDLESLKPKESWDHKLSRLMDYFEKDSQIRDILITGGDALMTRNKPLAKILDAVLMMAKRKQEANADRQNGEKYAEIQRVRLGSRLLAYLPFRIDRELIEILKNFKKRGSEIGIKQFVIQTHFQSPLEITMEAKRAIEMILSAGWTISNQLVFTTAASRRGHTAKLRHALNSLGVVTYYTFTVKGFKENRTVFTPNSRSIQEQMEEKIFGKMTEEQQKVLNDIFLKNADIAKNLNRFMRENNLPFLPTDRNVLNLPAIGKSITFKMIGITTKGERVLKFDHDSTRKHSPIIDQMGEVFIVENRSVASYLREIEAMGEKVSDYSSVWNYTSGKTEPVFWLFKYPTLGFEITDKFTNLAI
ncbi:MAG: KamA family protein [Rikenellaceae bacterium]